MAPLPAVGRPRVPVPPQESFSEPSWLGLASTGRFVNEDGLDQLLASPRLARPFAPGTPEVAPTWRPLPLWGPADVSCASLWQRPV